MSKEPHPKCAEWKGNVETILTKALSIAFAENKGRKKKPDRERFKKEAIPTHRNLYQNKKILLLDI